MASKQMNRAIPAKELTPREKAGNSLRLKLDDMTVIKPKTEKQMDFFEAYQASNYFMAYSTGSSKD